MENWKTVERDNYKGINWSRWWCWCGVGCGGEREERKKMLIQTLFLILNNDC